MRVSPRLLWIAVGLSIAIGAAALGLLGARVQHLERGELQLESEPRSIDALKNDKAATRVSVRLLEVELKASERALFELCAANPLTDAAWRGAFDVVVFRWSGAKPELMLRVPLDAEHLAQAERNASDACLPLGGGVIEQAGRHTFELVFAEKPPGASVSRVPLRARVLARTPLGTADRTGVRMLVGAVLLLLTALFLLPRDELNASHSEPPQAPAISAPRALAVGAASLLALLGATFLPFDGSALGLAKGALIVALQTLCALVFAGLFGRERRAALGLQAPKTIWPWVVSAPFVAYGLAQCARLALRVVPSTGEAPIQSFVSWPSGMLAFAAMGVLAPVAEELFFRGLLFRIALPLGRFAACAITLVLFVALHLAQSWGNWGGVLAVALTGLVLTVLRATSDSVLPSALAHVLYNAALSLNAL